MTRNATVLLCFVLAAFAAHAGELTVEVLDVGQGDSILIRTPAEKVILIDAGDDPHEVGRLLKERRVEHLDLVVATHPHADHIGGMLDVVSQIQTKLYTDNGLPHSTATYRALMERLEEKRIKYRAAVVGQKYNLDDGATFEVIFPRGDALRGTRSDLNANSVVTRLRHQGHCFLFVGDSEEPTERALLDGDLGKCDVLKVAHHGSDYSSSQAFLGALQPKIAVISVGVGNTYGHPGPQTLSRLQGLKASIYRTDVDGTVTFTSSEAGIAVKTAHEVTAPETAAPLTDAASAKSRRGHDHEAPPAPSMGSPTRAGVDGACAYVASEKGKVFHEASCGNGKRISPKNLRCYPTREAALAGGKKPAGCCRP